MVSLPLQMYPRPSLTISRADDSVLNDTKKREVAFRHNCLLFAKALKHPFSNFLFSLCCYPQVYIWLKMGNRQMRSWNDLSLELAGKWKTLGRRLGFSPAAIRNYDGDNPKLADKAFNMLIDWKQGQGSKATYTVLNDALCHKLVNCKLLAEQFCCDKTEGNASP